MRKCCRGSSVDVLCVLVVYAPPFDHPYLHHAPIQLFLALADLPPTNHSYVDVPHAQPGTRVAKYFGMARQVLGQGQAFEARGDLDRVRCIALHLFACVYV